MSLALPLATVAIVLIGCPVTPSRADGIVPGSFSYKLHATVPLLAEKEFYPPFQRLPDVKGLYGAPFTQQAGEHADMSVLAALKVSGSQAVLNGSEIPEEMVTELPPGPIVDIGDVQPCTHTQFLNTISESAGGCPAASQVGVASVIFGGVLTDRTYPLYKLAAALGHLATFGFPYELLSQPMGIRVNEDLRASSDYGLNLTSSQIGFNKFVPAPFLTIWGVPAAPAHDSERWNPQTRGWGDSLEGPQVPLVANAMACDAGTQEARERLRYWSAPERWLPEDPEDFAFRSFAPSPRGCDRLGFAPQGEVSLGEGRGGTAGIDLLLRLPRAAASDPLETPPLEGAVLTLPAGMSVNPAGADGLAGCTPEQVGLESDTAAGSAPRFSATEAECPAASGVGEAVVDTPLAEAPLTGKIYFATPYRNPFHSLLALYIVLPGPGFTAKLAAEVKAEPGSGRLEASLAPLPQLPVDSVRLSLAGGSRAPLALPPGCGEGAIELSLTPWSAPESGPPARIVSHYSYATVAGDRCTDASRPPSALLAGSTVAAAGQWSPFVLRLQASEPGAFTVNLPPGLSARVRGVGRCGEGEIERAEARRGPGGGLAERQDPSCPASSRVGSLLIGAGPGPAPLAVAGEVYLAGPYGGAPFSLVAITPALAGGTANNPLFDLGTVVDRVALDVDRRSGAVSARVGAPPRAIDGIPLRIGDIRLVLDRPDFVRNPSRCAKMVVTASGVEDPVGAPTAPASDFRVNGCDHLGFRPELRVTLARGHQLGARPATRAVLRAKPGEAAIAAARLILPASERLDRRRHGDACEAVPVGPGGCPPTAIHGHATAWSGLLDHRLAGPVYLRSRAGARPELVLALGGEPRLEIPVRIRPRRGRVQLELSRLPDLQLTKLVIGLWGGRRGLLVNRRDLCAARGEAIARLVSGGGAVRVSRTRFGGSCPPARRHSEPNRQIAKRMEG